MKDENKSKWVWLQSVRHSDEVDMARTIFDIANESWAIATMLNKLDEYEDDREKIIYSLARLIYHSADMMSALGVYDARPYLRNVGKQMMLDGKITDNDGDSDGV